MYKFDLKYSQLDSFAEDLKYKCRLDIKSYAHGAAKRIIGGYMDKHKIDGPDELIRWININPGNKNDFMRALIPDKTEFFRDPGLWRYLEEEVPAIINKKGSIKVLDLGASSGEEIYSFSILMNSLGLDNKVDLVAVDKFKVKLDQLKEGKYSIKSLESSENNYSRFKQGNSIKPLIDRTEESFILSDLFRNKIETKLFDITSDRAFDQFDIVLCRNVMCYISLKKSRPVYKLLSDFTKKDGLLILGVQEDMANSFYSRDFNCINEEFKVYQKTR